jgi:hypothetical protein
MQRLDLAHHLFVDVQATGGIDDDHVDEFELGFFNSRLAMSTGFWLRSDGKKVTPIRWRAFPAA